MVELIRVTRKSEIAPGTARAVVAGRTPVALYNVDGQLYATHGICLHAHGPLGEGTIEGITITCPWHSWQYDVTTGACMLHADWKLPTYEVKVEGDDVFVRL